MNVAQIITAAAGSLIALIAVGGILYHAGRTSQRVSNLVTAVEALTTALTEHEVQSVKRVDKISDRVARLEGASAGD